jgi:hypothetical protein
MKQSTIKRVIRRKLDEWIESIESEIVRDAVRDDAIVSGGCIVSMLSEERVNDYDVYMRTKESARLVAGYYVDKFNADNGKLPSAVALPHNPVIREETRENIRGELEDRIVIYMKSAGVASEGAGQYAYFESAPERAADAFVETLRHTDELYDMVASDPIRSAEMFVEKIKEDRGKYRPIFFSENAVTLSDRVQIVIRFYGEPDKILDNYDYDHCRCWYDYRADRIEVPREALAAILSKTLVYTGSLYPLASVFRMRKFIARGWRITAGQALKMMLQVSKLDLEDISVLGEQLIGVDQAYMHQLINALRAEDPRRADVAYIAKVIDEIFE